jgi:HK97 family phage portal protein
VSLIRRHSAPTEQRLSFQGYASLLTGNSGLGSDVTADSAMRHDAVWSCRTRIAQDVSMMPVDVVRYVNGTRQDVSPAPQIIAAPSVYASPMDWRYQVVDSWLGWGNAWGLVTGRSVNGLYPTRIELQNPASVVVRDTPDGPTFFVNKVEHFLFPVGDLWHVPAYTTPGSLLGLSPIAYHRLAISTGLEAQRFGNGFFQDGGHPNAIVGVEGTPTEEQAKSLKDKLLGITRGNRELIVMPKSTTYTQLSVNPDDSQFIETMRYSVEQVCRIFGEDPADHGASAGGSSLTYANRSDADLARFKRRQFWVTKLQDALTALIPRPQVVKLNTASSLMMTTRERHEVHKIRLDSQTITVNEVRKIEDEPPFEGAEFDVPTAPKPAPAAVSPARSEPVINVDARTSVDPTFNVDARQDPPIVNIEPTTVHNEFTMPDIDVDARQEPPVVNVTTPDVVVNVPEQRAAPVGAVRKTIEHTADGRIAAIIEEPA